MFAFPRFLSQVLIQKLTRVVMGLVLGREGRGPEPSLGNRELQRDLEWGSGGPQDRSLTRPPCASHPGPLMRVLLVTVAPVYWALAGETGDALNGHSLTGGSFLQKSHVEFATGEQGSPPGGPGGAEARAQGLSPVVTPGRAGGITGELLTMTQEARGLDPDGLLLLDVVVSGVVPGSLADADLEAQVGTHPEACRWGWGANGMCCPRRPLLTPQAGAWGVAWPGLSPVGGCPGSSLSGTGVLPIS